MAAGDPVFYRSPGAEAVVIFVHGFTGGVETWTGFPALLRTDPTLAHYDFSFWEYPSTLDPTYLITKFFWTNDPKIQTIGQGLRTLCNNFLDQYKKIILVGHSMGGLVIQTFVLEEILQNNRRHLDRLTEIVLYGTPSGGLKRAAWGSFLKNQIADMSISSVFIQKLRSEWTRLIDDQRNNADCPTHFRLTLVAGMKDNFVPPESSLDPFLSDEKEWVGGDHVSMVKPASADSDAYRVLKVRLLRGTPTEQERALINGKSEQAIRYINRIRAATELNDVDDLNELADELLKQPQPSVPLAERATGLALLGHEEYGKAIRLLTRYLDFHMPGDNAQPFRSDVQVVQQLAIALSGTGDLPGAIARLRELPSQMQEDPETQGILAGRFKRQWLKNPSRVNLGRKTFDIYKSAFDKAKDKGEVGQILYNGINAAYVDSAIGGNEAREIANVVLNTCREQRNPDYWCDATRAEAHLLLRQYEEATKAYKDAQRREHAPREWTTTGQQALDIVQRQGQPPESATILALFKDIQRDY